MASYLTDLLVRSAIQRFLWASKAVADGALSEAKHHRGMGLWLLKRSREMPDVEAPKRRCGPEYVRSDRGGGQGA
jgi:hypothetical protein